MSDDHHQQDDQKNHHARDQKENASSETSPQGSTPEKDKLVNQYWKHLLTEGSRPASVFAFSEQLGQEESAFYEHFSSFESLEGSYWKSTVEETVATLHEDSDYANYPADQKLLAFFYTWFAHVQKHRSRLVKYFPKMGLCGMKTLQPMRHSFLSYATELIKKAVEDGTIADRKKLNDYYDRALFEHFRMLIEFYRNDNSDGFQDTDAFIEKSTQLAIDSAHNGVIDSALDLARFMLRKLPISK